MMSNTLIELKNIYQGYEKNNQLVTVLENISIDFERSNSYAIVGPSGAGKSTLLNIIGLLDKPRSGKYFLNKKEISKADADEIAKIRNEHIGFVFQSFNLLPRLTSLENIELPLVYRGCAPIDARRRALALMEKVGLSEKAQSYPADLSGGQRQRVAIARALVGKPSLILADEPTGSLDAGAAEIILNLLLEMNQADGTTLVVVTHDSKVAHRMNRQLVVNGGSVRQITDLVGAQSWGNW